MFGRVIQGQDVVTEVESQKTDAKNRPAYVKILIANCGELIPKSKARKLKGLIFLAKCSRFCIYSPLKVIERP